MVMDQFCAPVALRCLQKLKLLTFNLYPALTVKVNVTVGEPPEFESAMASPLLPAKLVQVDKLFVQEELAKCESKMAGEIL